MITNFASGKVVEFLFNGRGYSGEVLENGFIKFLISQKSEEQAYIGATKLFNYVVKKEEIPKSELMPIDIITRENLKYYQ